MPLVNRRRCDIGRVASEWLAVLSLALLPAPVWAEPAAADGRVLRVQDGDASRRYTVSELVGSQVAIILSRSPVVMSVSTGAAPGRVDIQLPTSV